MTLQDYLNALNAYRGFHPDGWIALYRYLPTWLGLILLVLGGLMVPFGGGHRTYRISAAPLGALVGFICAPALAQVFGLLLAPNMVALVGALALGVAGALFPPVVGFFAAGVPVALLCGALAGQGDFLVGFLPAFLLVGAVGGLAVRIFSAVMTAVLGAWLVVLGAFATFHRAIFVPELAAHTWAVLTIALLFAIVGATYQLGFRPAPEQLAKEKAERAKSKREAEEKQALEERWSSYSENNRKR